MSRPHTLRSLVLLGCLVVAPAVVSSCSSDDDASSTSEVVVVGAPLTMTAPTIVTDGAGGVVVIGTLSNVTERSIEVESATSSAGPVQFVAADGGAEPSLVIEPDSELELSVVGFHLAIPGVGDDVEAVEVTLELDIEDQFTFSAARDALE